MRNDLQTITKMSKTNKFEIDMNNLENVPGGILVSGKPIMQLSYERERPSLELEDPNSIFDGLPIIQIPD